MKGSYTLTKKIYSKYLESLHWKTNFCYLIFFTFFFFILFSKVVALNLLFVILCYIGSILILTLILLLFNKLFTWLSIKANGKELEASFGTYEFLVDNKGITQMRNQNKQTFLWNEIAEIKKNRFGIMLYKKDENVAMLFIKSAFPNIEVYHQLMTMIEKNRKPLK